LGPCSSNRQRNQESELYGRREPPWSHGQIVHQPKLKPDNYEDGASRQPEIDRFSVKVPVRVCHAAVVVGERCRLIALE